MKLLWRIILVSMWQSLLICCCSSDKENHDACWSGSLPENSVPEIEVAEVAYTADEEE